MPSVLYLRTYPTSITLNYRVSAANSKSRPMSSATTRSLH